MDEVDWRSMCCIISWVCCRRECELFSVSFVRWRSANQWGLVGVRALFVMFFHFSSAFSPESLFYSLLFIISAAVEVDELEIACGDGTPKPFKPPSDLSGLPRDAQIARLSELPAL